MQCSKCGAINLVRDIRDMPYTHKGETTVIPDVEGDYCLSCREAVLDEAQGERVSAAMVKFNRVVNAAIADPSFILSVRVKLKLDQRQVSEIFVGETNAFSRYERGQAKPPLALVKLLRLLDRCPELLDEVRQT